MCAFSQIDDSFEKKAAVATSTGEEGRMTAAGRDMTSEELMGKVMEIIVRWKKLGKGVEKKPMGEGEDSKRKEKRSRTRAAGTRTRTAKGSTGTVRKARTAQEKVEVHGTCFSWLSF